jgi:hypothetical protein
MGKIINLLLSLFAIYTLAAADDDDVINTDNISVFPKGYSAKIRAGYLSITPYTQSFYYILCERYCSSELARMILKVSLSFCG